MPEYESVLIIRVDFGQMAHDEGRTEGQIAFWSNLNLSSAIYGFQFHKNSNFGNFATFLQCHRFKIVQTLSSNL